MNLGKIRASEFGDSRFLKDVTRRLSRILSPLSREDGEVLGHILHIYQFQFADGLVVNGNDETSMIGRSDAAVILAALCEDVDEDWQWWRSRISPSHLNVEEFNRRLERLLGKILTHESIRGLMK